MGLFQTIQPEEESRAGRPLADRMRPQTLDEFIGQEELLGPGKPLRMQIERDDLSSLLLWGPPGCGKTTLARIIANAAQSTFVPFSAVLSGIKEIKEVMAKADARAALRAADDRVRRRGPPVQPRAAGRVFAARRGGEHPADRRDHGESVVRSDCAAAFAHESVRAARARDGADRRRCSSGRWQIRCAASANEQVQATAEILERIAILANGDARAAYNTLEALVLGTEPEAEGRRVLSRSAA